MDSLNLVSNMHVRKIHVKELLLFEGNRIRRANVKTGAASFAKRVIDMRDVIHQADRLVGARPDTVLTGRAKRRIHNRSPLGDVLNLFGFQQLYNPLE